MATARLKTLHNKTKPDLGVVDYTQWERPSKPHQASGKTSAATTKSAASVTKEVAPRKEFTVEKPVRGPNLANQKRNHLTRRYPDTKTDGIDTVDLLEQSINSKRKVIEKFRDRQAELLRRNIALKQDVEEFERPDHDHEKAVLRKYEKFRGGIAYLNENFATALAKEKAALAETKTRCQTDIASLEKELASIDKVLEEKRAEVHTLSNYKDKEYPVRAMEISELGKDLAHIQLINEEEKQELKAVVRSELEKMCTNAEKAQQHIVQDSSDLVFEKMHPSLKEMASSNQIMVCEITAHEKEVALLTATIAQLEKDVTALVRDPHTDLRRQAFPHLFSGGGLGKLGRKCEPDDDIVLNIKRDALMPI